MKTLSSWKDFTWPDWVPQELRKQVEDFWSPHNGRGPADWEANAADPYNGGAPLGTRGSFVTFDRHIASGRYVHAWNNVGRVVLDDGTYQYVSGGVTVEWAQKRAQELREQIDGVYAHAKKLEADRAELTRFLAGGR